MQFFKPAPFLSEAATITQDELGKRVGLDQAYISRLERGTAEGTPSQILELAHALGVPEPSRDDLAITQRLKE